MKKTKTKHKNEADKEDDSIRVIENDELVNTIQQMNS